MVAYVKECDMCLASKIVQYKPYGNLQSLLVPTYSYKNLSMDFVKELPILTHGKGNIFELILALVD